MMSKRQNSYLRKDAALKTGLVCVIISCGTDSDLGPGPPDNTNYSGTGSPTYNL